MTEQIAHIRQTLDGNENAFALIGTVRRWLKQLGIERAVIDQFTTECMDAKSFSDLKKHITAKTGVKFTRPDDDDDDDPDDEPYPEVDEDDPIMESHLAMKLAGLL